MKATTSCSWVLTLSLMSILSAVVGTIPARSQPVIVPGTVESHLGGSQETLIPAKPKGSRPDSAMRSGRPPDIPDQTPAPSVRAQALEERIRRGEMERPIAQGEISDRLEQLHRGSAGGSTGESAHRQSAQGN